MDTGFLYARDCEKRAAYEEGYQDAVNKACEWLNNNARHILSAELRRQFRKAMEE